jgi:molybdopterin synthase sulfur carrier subunit
MRLRLRFFASVREAFGTGAQVLDLATPPGTLIELLAALDPERRHPALWDERLRVAVNGVVLESGSAWTIADNDEVALLPPVTGG